MDGVIVTAREGERPLTPLHPNHVKVLRASAALAALPILIASLMLEAAIDGFPTGVIAGPVLLAMAFVVVRMPLRRYLSRGYDVSADRLRIVRGVWFHSDTVVPFGRVQHIDVTQGALERGYGLATLVLHTAGTHNASVALPGLAHADAVALRDVIAAHIKRAAR